MGNIKWIIPRKYFAITKPLSNREFKKLRQWIENHEHVDFFTDSERRVWFANRTKIDEYREKREAKKKELEGVKHG